MPTTATTWRSPLSILMGAKRNDDSNLEPPPPPPSTPGAESSNGIAAYIPFNYFGLKSPAPDRHNGEVESMTSSSAHPPLGAFPPPITNTPCSERDNLIDNLCFIS